MSTHPEVLWAQRSSDSDAAKNVIFLTVNLPDIQEQTLKVDLTSTSLSFEARAGNTSKNIAEKDYAFSIKFFKEVDPDLSSKKLSSRSLYFVLRKKDKGTEYWPRLTNEKARNAFIRTDFSKWVDEDEQGEGDKFDDDFGDMGMGGAGGLGGDMDLERMMAQMKDKMPGGAGAGAGAGDDDSDSDDNGAPLK
ncbi:hypothetical protein BBP40_000645 [Aspergillus hancockii]|nr:hypothetical protein BBP40_000645 [Aspergillus hancockii]